MESRKKLRRGTILNIIKRDMVIARFRQFAEIRQDYLLS